MKGNLLRVPAIMIVIGIVIAIAASLLTSMQKAPTVTEQDFDFSITYKLDGETKTLSGVYRCRFTGFGKDGIDPLCRYYKGEYIVDENTSPSRLFTIANEGDYELYIVALFNDSYLMGDVENDSYEACHEAPSLYAEDKECNQYDETNLPDVFDAEIISWDYPKPIENTFYFTSFSGLYVINMGVMCIVGILTLILCMIFVKKGDGVAYSGLDQIGAALNFAAMLFAFPVIFIASSFIQAYPTAPDWIYQVYLCIPQIIPFSVAASLSLRRKGFRKSGFCIQFLAPVILAILCAMEYAY